MSKKKQANAEIRPELSSRKLSIRVTPEEYEIIQSYADEIGVVFSQAVRSLLFKKSGLTAPRVSDAESRYKLVSVAQNLRSSFNKLCASFRDAVDAYSRSVDILDENGRPYLSTDQTIRHLDGLESRLMELQKLFNESLKNMDSSEVHYAARSAPESKVGKLIAEDRENERMREQSEQAAAQAAATEDPNQSSLTIPNRYRFMLKANATGELVKDARVIQNKQGGESVYFRIKIETARFDKHRVYYVDVIMPKNSVFPFLKEGWSVSVFGDYSDDMQVVNEETYITRTIYAYQGGVSMPFRYDPSTPPEYRASLKVTLTGTLFSNAESFTAKNGNEMMRFRVKVETFRGVKKTHYVYVVMPKTNVFPYLQNGKSVTIVGDYDDSLRKTDNGLYISKTVYAEDLALPT